MKAYSEDLRVRVVEAVDGGMARAEAARVYTVSRAIAELGWTRKKSRTANSA